MSLLDFIQPSHPTHPSHLSTSRIPYHLAPCAKAIAILLMILSGSASGVSFKNEDSSHDKPRRQEGNSFLGSLLSGFPTNSTQPKTNKSATSNIQNKPNKVPTKGPSPNAADKKINKSVNKKINSVQQQKVPEPKPESIIELNPQIGIYIANQIAAQKMFITDDLQHRQRETLYIDPLTGERKTTNMWLNTSSTASRFNAGHKQLNTKISRYAIQLGGPLIKWSYGENDQGLLGITTGLGRATNNSYSASSNNQVHGSVEGYNLGLYSIWFADNDTRLGTYVDLLTQYSFFKNHIRTPGVRDVTHYQSYVFTTALETGYKIQLLEKEQARLFVQPNAKVSWQLSSGLQHEEVAREPVTIEKSDSVVTKLGIRTALEFDIATLSTKNLQISPSFEANWIHNNGNQGTWLSQTRVTPQGNRDIAELKLGIESQISNNLQLWTNLGQQFGRQKYSETQATIGGNYHF